MQNLQSSHFHLESLTKDIDVSGFCCSETELTDYLKDEALRDQQYLFSTTHLMMYDNRIVGYFTLVNDTINPDKISEEISAKYEYAKLPALKIARLAVDNKYVGMGIGKVMMSHIYATAINTVKAAGCRVLTVDSKIDAQAFYEHLQFEVIPFKGERDTIPMFFDIRRLMDF